MRWRVVKHEEFERTWYTVSLLRATRWLHRERWETLSQWTMLGGGEGGYSSPVIFGTLADAERRAKKEAARAEYVKPPSRVVADGEYVPTEEAR